MSSSASNEVPYGQPLGVALGGVVAYSHGSDGHHHECGRRNIASRGGRSYETGTQWHAIEFARRWLLQCKGIVLRSVTTAEDIFALEDMKRAEELVDPDGGFLKGPKVYTRAHSNGAARNKPQVGDLLIWQRDIRTPFGHVAVVVGVDERTSRIQIGEQNMGLQPWGAGKKFAREIAMSVDEDSDMVELHDPVGPILGWLNVDAPMLDPESDFGDQFRSPLTHGAVERHTMERVAAMPWLAASEPCDFFLRRSMLKPDGSLASEEDLASGYYTVDYDFWLRARQATEDLHKMFVGMTSKLVLDSAYEEELTTAFEIPADIIPQLRRSLSHPSFLGRFDLGFDGTHLKCMEYNSDSSGALLETCDTQQKMAAHYGFDKTGVSSGAPMRGMLDAFWRDVASSKWCPPTKVVHFMVDDEDEERYTALCVIRSAKAAGFKCKLCVQLVDFRFAASGGDVASSPSTPPPETADGAAQVASPSGAPTAASWGPGIDDPRPPMPPVVDLEGLPVMLVWKSWSWDTVLRDYEARKGQARTRPALSDILLSPRVVVLEPLWKCVAGSKALLPHISDAYPTHDNVLHASYNAPDDAIMAKHGYVSKPVSGRAGQNITVHDDGDEGGTPVDEKRGGRFDRGHMIWQERIALKRFDDYFPIFGTWMINTSTLAQSARFGGVTIREDRSRITSLNSAVAPCRVLREQ